MQGCPNEQMALSFNQQIHFLLPLITGHYYYSRCAQFVNTLSARIFDCSLPEREFEIRKISHNTVFAILLLIDPVTSCEETEMTVTRVKNLTFSVAKQLHRITEFSEIKNRF